MKRVILKCGLALASVMAMSSCADMMLSTDFGYGDFYPDYSDYNWYWNSYPITTTAFSALWDRRRVPVRRRFLCQTTVRRHRVIRVRPTVRP